MNISETFWTDVEKDLKYVLYTDTDSLFINIQSIVPKDSKEAVMYADKLGTEINDVIQQFTEEVVLKKLGIDIAQNQTFYKTELVADGILFVDVKKNYAFSEIAHKGVIRDKPKIKYTGIPVVKSNFSKMSQDIIREFVENVGLSKQLTEKSKIFQAINDLAKIYIDRINDFCNDYDLREIGVPCKWSSGSYKSEPATVTSMRLYNTIFDIELFKPMGSALHVPITINSPTILESYISPLRHKSLYYLNNTPMSNITYIAVPYNHDPVKIKEKLTELNIVIDRLKVWSIVYGTTAKRIVETIKTNYE